MSFPDGCWSSHLEALAWSMAHTTGAVFEYGVGWYSTPLLHGLCEAQGRELWSFEDHAEWLANIDVSWKAPWHHYNEAGGPDPGLVFVDDDAHLRAEHVAAHHAAALVVCHDTEDSSIPGYPGMDLELSKYKFKRVWKLFPVWTTVVSDWLDLDVSCEGAGGHHDGV